MSGYGYHWSKCSSGGGIAGIGVLVAIVIAAEVIAHAIVWLIAGSMAGIVVSLAAVVLLTRPLRRWEREASVELERTRPARLAAMRAAPQVTATVVPPAIEQHFHLHLHGDASEAARVIRTIPGYAGEAITEGK